MKEIVSDELLLAKGTLLQGHELPIDDGDPFNPAMRPTLYEDIGDILELHFHINWSSIRASRWRASKSHLEPQLFIFITTYSKTNDSGLEEALAETLKARLWVNNNLPEETMSAIQGLKVHIRCGTVRRQTTQANMGDMITTVIKPRVIFEGTLNVGLSIGNHYHDMKTYYLTCHHVVSDQRGPIKPAKASKGMNEGSSKRMKYLIRNVAQTRGI